MRTLGTTGLRAGTALMALSVAVPAMASSIERVTTAPALTPHITVLSCTATCPPLKNDLRTATYVVPDLAPGTDRTEIRQINGVMKSVRAEAWLGGSPVTFVSKASEADIRLARGEPAAPVDAGLNVVATAEAGGAAAARARVSMNVAIDRTLTTAALSSVSQATVAAPTTPVSPSQDFDGQTFELRLD